VGVGGRGQVEAGSLAASKPRPSPPARHHWGGWEAPHGTPSQSLTRTGCRHTCKCCANQFSWDRLADTFIGGDIRRVRGHNGGCHHPCWFSCQNTAQETTSWLSTATVLAQADYPSLGCSKRLSSHVLSFAVAMQAIKQSNSSFKKKDQITAKPPIPLKTSSGFHFLICLDPWLSS